jgi:hypothetical protein
MYKIGSEFRPEQFVFIDETSKDERSLSRAYGYGLKNMRVEKHVVFVRGKRYTILPALTLDGFIAADIMEGSCNKERFQTFILTQVVCFFLIYLIFFSFHLFIKYIIVFIMFLVTTDE